jgi:hypothetical protein
LAAAYSCAFSISLIVAAGISIATFSFACALAAAAIAAAAMADLSKDLFMVILCDVLCN